MPTIKPMTVIGDGVRFGADVHVWHFTTIGHFVVLDNYVTIGSHCYIGEYSVIGAESRIQTGVFLPNRSKVGERVFIGPHVCCTDDRYPRVNNHKYQAEPPIFEDDCSVGAASVILPGVKIGKGAMVGAGTIVTHNVEPYHVVVGNPSRIIKIEARGGAIDAASLLEKI